MHELHLDKALIAVWDASAVIQDSPSVRATPPLRRLCYLLDYPLAQALATISTKPDMHGQFSVQESHEADFKTKVTAAEGTD